MCRYAFFTIMEREEHHLKEAKAIGKVLFNICVI